MSTLRACVRRALHAAVRSVHVRSLLERGDTLGGGGGVGGNPTNKRQRHPVLLLLRVSRGTDGQRHISHQSTRLQADLQTAEHRVSEQASGHAAGESERSALGWREARADRHSTGRNDQGALRHDSQRGADRSRARLRQDRRLSSPPVGRNRLVREETPRHRLEHNHRRRVPGGEQARCARSTRLCERAERLPEAGAHRRRNGGECGARGQLARAPSPRKRDRFARRSLRQQAARVRFKSATAAT